MNDVRTRYIRYLATVAIAVTVVSFSYSYVASGNVDDTTRELLSLDGFNAVLFPPTWASYGYFTIQVIALLLLFWTSQLSKYFFLTNVVFFNGLGLMIGVSIALPAEIFLTAVVQYLYGAIILLLLIPRAAWASASET